MQRENINDIIKTIQRPVLLEEAPPTGDNYRALEQEEIDRLSNQGNYCDDWSSISVTKRFTPDRIRRSTLSGRVQLGKSVEIVDSTIRNSTIGDDVTIRGVHLVDNYRIGDRAQLEDLGALICDGETTFGNGTELPIAIETGGREVQIFAEMNIPLASAIATGGRDKESLGIYGEFLDRYLEQIRSERGIICRDAKLRHSRKILNSWIGPSAIIDNVTLVKNSTIISSAEEPVVISDGAYVINSLLQWGCEVTSMSVVENSLLTEHSHVERHGKVLESIVGPNTGVAEGEVTASLLGPFVGFHHQALLIAAFWPEGKGNVSYGSNVGSNHTSRAPDQEIWPGEGIFFGLGCSVKFPANYAHAPYTIIATGITTLPQLVTLPFSLINLPRQNNPYYPRGYNEIIPGWVLAHNIFMIKRNEVKYTKRNKARRSTFDFEVFRPAIINQMIQAREELQDIDSIRDFYTYRDIAGVGKNVMIESSRRAGIDTYTYYIEYYALRGLLRELRNRKKLPNPDSILDEETENPRWEHERKLLNSEPGLSKKSVADLLTLFMEREEEIARELLETKRKDDERGNEIIDDYNEVHLLAEDQSFVKTTFQELEKLHTEVDELLNELQG